MRIRKVMSGLEPGISSLYEGDEFVNADKTGDECAATGKSWKEYWQIFTQQDFPNVCPFCGFLLSDNEVEGCHIKIVRKFAGGLSASKFIIPGHHHCNMQKKDIVFFAKISVQAVEAKEKK